MNTTEKSLLNKLANYNNYYIELTDAYTYILKFYSGLKDVAVKECYSYSIDWLEKEIACVGRWISEINDIVTCKDESLNTIEVLGVQLDINDYINGYNTSVPVDMKRHKIFKLLLNGWEQYSSETEGTEFNKFIEFVLFHISRIDLAHLTGLMQYNNHTHNDENQ